MKTNTDILYIFCSFLYSPRLVLFFLSPDSLLVGDFLIHVKYSSERSDLSLSLPPSASLSIYNTVYQERDFDCFPFLVDHCDHNIMAYKILKNNKFELVQHENALQWMKCPFLAGHTIYYENQLFGSTVLALFATIGSRSFKYIHNWTYIYSIFCRFVCLCWSPFLCLSHSYIRIYTVACRGLISNAP